MQVTCPECNTPVEGEADQEIVCPACMNAFTVAPQAPPPPPPQAPISSYRTHTDGRSYDVQTAEGGLMNGLSRYAVREAVYLGRFTNTAKLRRADGSWEAIGNNAEFAMVFRLLGHDPNPAPASRKIASWKGEHPSETAPSPTPRTRPTQSAPSPSTPAPDPRRLIALGAALFLLLLTALFFAFR